MQLGINLTSSNIETGTSEFVDVTANRIESLDELKAIAMQLRG